MASLEEIKQERIKKAETLRRQGQVIYPVKVGAVSSIDSVLKKFSTSVKNQKKLKLAGRLMAKRQQGKIIFGDLFDGTNKIQILAKQGEMKNFDLFDETVDIGDFIFLIGQAFITKRREKTILLSDWKMLAKSLRPLPEKWHGLKDIEEKYRRRYLDSLMTEEVRQRFIIRGRMVNTIREILNRHDYLEFETPILQPQAGGATAKPFVTHHEALDVDLFLRIAPELYLKRLLIGGFPKVFELSRNFRNEGIDVTHNPEFTMLEFYESFSDADKQMAFTEKLIKETVKKIDKTGKLSYLDHKIDFTKPFKRISYYDLLKRHALLSKPESLDIKDLRIKANQLGVLVDPSDSAEKVMDGIYKKACLPKLIQPVFVVDYPKNYLPLAKEKSDYPELADAFQLIVAGLEIAKGFSELNDPEEQGRRFSNQDKLSQAGDDEAQTTDNDFISALEYGMPPAGGVGIGIDRLAMILTNQTNIREVIFFPTLRPKQ